MRSIKPWDSNEHPIQRIKNEIDDLFSRVFNDSFFSTPSLSTERFVPKCNIEEKRNHYLVEVEIPGVDPNDVVIELDGNVLTIKGERKRKIETEDEDNKMHVIEQSYGSFYRSFTLPDNVDAEQIDAKNKNGILTIKLPKKKGSSPRRIEIK